MENIFARKKKTDDPAADLRSRLTELKSPRKVNAPMIGIVIGVVVLALCLGGYYLMRRPNNESREVVEAVGKLMLLPEGETPTVATVSDISKLQNQEFFRNAQNGDKVIVYSASRKAILYRPSESKIVEVAPVVANQQLTNDTSTPSTETAKAIKVALYNGTTVTGLTYTVEPRIEAVADGITIDVRGNAVNQDYEETTVIDLTGENEATATAIADEIGGTVGELPEGETAPEADIFVILGSSVQR